MTCIDVDSLAQYERDARTGRAEALYNLGLAYSTGQGVTQDYVAAHKWFNLAAMRGSTPWLGVVFVVLLGVAFVGIASTLFPMLQGGAGTEPRAAEPPPTERWLTIISPAVLALAVLALGIYVPGGVDALLRRAVGVLGQ